MILENLKSLEKSINSELSSKIQNSSIKYNELLIEINENDLIDVMKTIPQEIDFSSLPHLEGDKRTVVISVGSYDKDEAENYFNLFINLLNTKNIKFILEDK